MAQIIVHASRWDEFASRNRDKILTAMRENWRETCRINENDPDPSDEYLLEAACDFVFSDYLQLGDDLVVIEDEDGVIYKP